MSSFDKWLSPLRMLGMAFLFTGITLALTVIIGTLRLQAGMLARFYQQASGRPYVVGRGLFTMESWK